MKCILGKKVGMVQLFDVTGKVWPATVVYCEPNKVIQVKKNSVVVGFDSVNGKKLNKPQIGVFKKAGIDTYYRHLREFANTTDYEVGQDIKVNQFKSGEFVDVQGTTKGHGFTGAIKRWNFKIGPLGHGAGYPHRYQGSVIFGRGGSQGQRVRKGQKMAGHYGNELVTIQNLQVLYINDRDNTITILGAIPGHVNGIVFIKESVKKPHPVKPVEIITKSNMEEIQDQAEILLNKELMKEQNNAIDAAAAQQEQAKALEKQAKEIAKKDVAKSSNNGGK